MSFGNSDSGHSIVGNSVTTGAWMELGSNSDHQSRLRNESTSGRFYKGRRVLAFAHDLYCLGWTMTTRGRLSHHWRAYELGCWTSHLRAMPWFTEEEVETMVAGFTEMKIVSCVF